MKKAAFLFPLFMSMPCLAADFSDFASAQQVSVPSYMPGPPTKKWSGKTLSGNDFTFFGDGSGHVAPPGGSITANNWSVNCNNDAMTDVRTCSATHFDLNLLVVFTKTAPSSICVADHDFPNKDAMIRVGDGAPIVAPGRLGCVIGQEAAKIATSLSPGIQVRTRSYKFPYENARDHSGVVDGTYPDLLRLVSYLFENNPRLRP